MLNLADGRLEGRADRAHQATKDRARRRAQALPLRQPGLDDGCDRDLQAVQDFTETLTALLAQSGLPRMMARVMACLYVIDSGTLTASDLVQRPQVSPASVSHAVTFLEQQGMLRREQVSGERRERYAVDDEIWFRSLLAEVQASDAFVAAITRGAEILGPTSPEGACLESSAELLRLIADALRQVMEQWRQILAARNAAG